MSLGDDTVPNKHLEEGNLEAILGLAVRLRAVEESQAYCNRMVEELRREIAILSRTCERIEKTFSHYELYLKEAIKNDEAYKKIRDEIISGVAKSAVWAIIGGFFIAVGYGIKAYAIELINTVAK